jgi:UDPglucose 6-dehydrogenase
VLLNEYQKQRFARRIVDSMFGSVRNKRLTLFGFAFKKNTGRLSFAISVATNAACD